MQGGKLTDIIMKPFEFKVITRCFQDASGLPGDDADFYLEEDNWNDYDYFVSYHLHATKRITKKDQNEYVASIRIMRHNQSKHSKYLLRDEFHENVFNELPFDFVSISFAHNLYTWLSYRDIEERKVIAWQLHLILSKDSPYYELVKDDDCFNSALLRDSTMDNYVLHKVNNLINQKDRRYDLRRQRIVLKYDNCDEKVRVSFSCLPDDESDDIPNGIVAFIGANGSGKSTALYALAKAMYLYPDDRDRLERKFCEIIPNDIGVERMILISYSPFDNFTMPSTINFAMNDIPDALQDKEGRFIYCGIRDLDVENKNGKLKDFKYIQADREIGTTAKTQERLACDFAMAFKKLKGSKNFSLWRETIEFAIPQFPDLAEKMELMVGLDDIIELMEEFMKLSTGYKFLFHSMSYVMTFILEGSLILFDEPENHIHPPLLSFMMARYRKILSKYGSVMLVSTHSPVIIQELFADNVLKVSRNGNQIIIRKPRIETFGATFGEINSEVFGLTTDVSGYFTAIDSLYDKLSLGSKDSSQKMFEDLQQYLGRDVSNQVASYLISKYYGDNPEKD